MLISIDDQHVYIAVFSAISELMVAPLQERMDDWKKTVVTLDREHTRGSFICDCWRWGGGGSAFLKTLKSL